MPLLSNNNLLFQYPTHKNILFISKSQRSKPPDIPHRYPNFPHKCSSNERLQTNFVPTFVIFTIVFLVDQFFIITTLIITIDIVSRCKSVPIFSKVNVNQKRFGFDEEATWLRGHIQICLRNFISSYVSSNNISAVQQMKQIGEYLYSQGPSNQKQANFLAYPSQYRQSLSKNLYAKRPEIIDGVYFKINHSLDIYSSHLSDFCVYDGHYEKDFLREHLVVVRKAIKDYFTEENIEFMPEIELLEPDDHIDMSVGNSYTIRKIVEEFLMKTQSYLQEKYQKKLEYWLKCKPVWLRIFQTFCFGLPQTLSQDLTLIIVWSFHIYIEFIQEQHINNDFLFQYKGYLQSKIQGGQTFYDFQFKVLSEAENTNRLIFSIAYSTALAAHGYFKNDLYLEEEEDSQIREMKYRPRRRQQGNLFHKIKKLKGGSTSSSEI